MKPLNKLRALLLVLSLILPVAGRTDDTELFLVNAGVAQQRPNVLIVLDNTANWNIPFSWEKTALQTVVSGLTDQFNVGLMLFTETGSGNHNPDGAYVRYAVRQMTADSGGVAGNKTNLVNLVNGIDVLADKSNGGKAGLTLYEAYQYYAGLDSYAGGPAGASNGKVKSDPGAFSVGGTYLSPRVNGCQNNFIIYISNGPVQDNANDTATATGFLIDIGGNTSEIGIEPNGSQSNISDEFARFLSSPTANGIANIVTYTVDVLPGTTGQGPGWTALLKSMAAQGKGKYFVGSDATTLTQALTDIFHEVMAVNSVFSSSTLPVNVSVRGTYLNQVYMAVFRPDAHSSPRWTGNLKQYKLGLDSVSDSVYLADKNGLRAENTLSGFVTPLATSVWTTASTFWDTAYYLDTLGESSYPLSDAPDGALVEKGGAAQHLRSGYSYSGGQPVRNLYTCSGLCSTGNSLSGYLFANSNNDITNAALGLSSGAVTVSNLVHTGTTATATATGHGFTTGQNVAISGANQAEYDGTYTVNVVDADHFTYTIAENPPTPATVAAGSTTIVATRLNTSYTLASITRSGTTATATMGSGLMFNIGSTTTLNFNMAGAAQPEYNGIHSVTLPPGRYNTFNYTVTTANVAESPVQPSSFGSSTPGYAISGCTSYANNAMSRASGSSSVVATLPQNSNKPTTPEACFPLGSTVTVSSVVPADYNVSRATITARTVADCKGATGNPKPQCVNTLTYSLPAGVVKTAYTSPVTPATPAVTGVPLSFDISWNYVNVVSINRSGGTATVVTNSNHNFSTGDRICITNAAQSEYNICAAITWLSATSFSYPVSYSPASPATGTITVANASASTLSKSELINWVRGQNTQLNDNPSLSSTAVRGYLHGDVLHSRPAVINYNRTGQPAGRDIVAYYGANDGIFHAVKGGDNDADGYEKWGFIPVEHFSKLKRLYEVTPIISTANPKPYFVDGAVGFYSNDANNDGHLTVNDGSGDQAYLFLSQRRGGRFYYALDVTNPDSPKFLWKKSNTDVGYAELGQTWSEPKVAKLRYQSGPVLVFGLGYDATANDANPAGTATMGRGVMVADMASGAPIWQVGPASAGAAYNQVLADMAYSIAADPVVLDTNNDGYTDRIYLADTGGNVWRINVDDALPSNWKVSKLASVGGSGANARKFLYPPDVIYSGTYDNVLIGSGDREHPFDATILNRFYMFKDDHALNAIRAPVSGAAKATLTEADLYDATDNLVQVGTTAQQAAATTALTNANGWYVTLGVWNNNTRAYQPIGEKVVGGSVSIGGATYFATNVPASSLASANPNSCTSSLGESRLYAVNFKTGAAILDLHNTDSGSYGSSSNYSTTPVVLTTSDRYQVQPGGGYAPSPVGAVVDLNGSPHEAVIIGTSVMQAPSQDLNRRHSIYWGLDID